MKYPYLVYRIIPGFYTNTEIQFVKDENLLKKHKGSTVFWENEIYDKSGKITLECRDALRLIAREQSRKSKRSVCLVFSQDNCDYFEPDGSLLHSTQPPYFKLHLHDGEYKTEIITNSGKIDKVNFTKIKNALSILIFFSLLFFNGCSFEKTNFAQYKSEIVSTKYDSGKTKNTKQKESKTNTNTRKKKGKTKQRKSKATARCKDGWISYSRSRRGTCSHHSGVAKWY